MKPIVKKVAGLIVVVSALASVVAGREQPSHAPARKSAARSDARAPAAADLDIAKLVARASEGARADAFARRDFAPPAPAPEAQPPAPAKPTAPPLPFKYLGRMSDGERLEIYLEQGQEFIAAEPGQRIGDYRVDKVTEETIVFTYLPLRTKQTLALESSG
ncbi:MAG TPA: hypothetical protein VFJ70_22105 [Burkholderiales bacterium]|nr:hypothetical protein [Burkholderiales bacterium]